MKRCTKCGELKSLAEFHKQAAASDGRKSACKKCLCAQASEYAARPDVKLAATIKYKERYKRDREEIIRKVKDYQARNPDKCRRNNAAYSESVNGRARQLWHRVKRRHKGSTDTLVSFERIRKALEKGVCEATGITFIMTQSDEYGRHRFGPSIDKIDPKGDYTEDNIHVVCNMYNFGKNEYTHGQFLEFCRAFIAHTDGAVE